MVGEASLQSKRPERAGAPGRALLLAGLAAFAAWSLPALPAAAQARLDARFTASLAGVPIGRGAWVVEIADDQFTAAASGMATGILRVIAKGQGTSASRGNIIGGALVPASYAATITADKRTDEVRLTLAGGHVRETAVVPPVEPSDDRIPVTDAHKNNVTDPLTGSIVRVPGTGDPVSPEACRRTVSVFDGRLRYDLKLSYKRMEKVKADKGYEGPAVVCAIQFVPIAGYVPKRAAIKYLIEQRDIEAWLAPIAGTRVLVPFRVSIPTPIGLGVLEATHFVANVQPKATPATARTQ